jgi:hypothetical protein
MIMPIHLLAGGWWMVDGGHHNRSQQKAQNVLQSLSTKMR